MNKFGTTKKKTLLHETVKSAISDVSASFRTHLWSDPTLESSGQTSLILKIQIRGYKSLYTTTKYQKYIPSKIVLHIYKQTNTHMNTDIFELIVGAFLFDL